MWDKCSHQSGGKNEKGIHAPNFQLPSSSDWFLIAHISGNWHTWSFPFDGGGSLDSKLTCCYSWTSGICYSDLLCRCLFCAFFVNQLNRHLHSPKPHPVGELLSPSIMVVSTLTTTTFSSCFPFPKCIPAHLKSSGGHPRTLCCSRRVSCFPFCLFSFS